ncbi:MAG: methylase involved in ubiquinone/menaquinone biosynthesis-like protein [Candidatus Woesebacteria bacterium GW2011_GWB1_43_14]|uniref:Methylase involved in ubiquinone/menaquinone biosynthesis-like protein n=1 Tax=Candidatus Woesebacteria bacterium GW2011_GWB1_43_14 TaxID=1618578 RepID=A0A0G1DH45_9BACT|nr:MAG: methylase involved in ubiquinone/menaquinone biosynthesis-like protein [Candidatus Woesebacteria bacterium GW2011_GWA1_39_11b]KKS78413.1 MAG: methylase involved in ubiquinone/menaquinone biosynthesis-like protein [Candidatus Woesebacteria bacterium GW2011_GWC1_42_9]KKS97170.1 MAG: methylase involved in ubiquinone/menaquinone biosynthesis-like protein [Candidatus Woesebacteria bacterium GW2011_GWB1_43_14]
MIWEEIFASGDTSYSESGKTQNQLFELVKLRFLITIFPKKHSLILEVGCGAARTSLYFAKRGHETTLLDQSDEVLKIAKENYKKEKAKGKFVVGDAEKLPFDSNQFDVVMSFGLLEHFRKPEIVITEMVRVLKPGGLFFADIVPKRFSVQSIGNVINFIFSIIYWTIKLKPLVGIKRGMRNFRPLYYENALSWMKYKKIMEEAGAKGIKVRGNRPWPRLTLPMAADRLYAGVLKPTMLFWRKFDTWDNFFPRFWGAGWWFWGIKR